MVSKEQYKIIKYAYSTYRRYDWLSAKTKIPVDEIDNLCAELIPAYLRPTYDAKSSKRCGVTASKDGKAFVDNEVERKRHFWITTIISAIAIVISIFAILKPQSK